MGLLDIHTVTEKNSCKCFFLKLCVNKTLAMCDCPTIEGDLFIAQFQIIHHDLLFSGDFGQRNDKKLGHWRGNPSEFGRGKTSNRH